jgi:hypothetical protein
VSRVRAAVALVALSLGTSLGGPGGACPWPCAARAAEGDEQGPLPPPIVRRGGQVLPAPAPGARTPPAPPTQPPPRPPDAASGTGSLPRPTVRGMRGSDLPAERAAPGGPAAPARPGALVDPPRRPERPTQSSQPRPEDLLFEVERPGGILKRYPEGDGSAIYVMAGNPRLIGSAHRRADGKEVEALSLKGATFVAWVDERALPEFKSLSIPGAEAPGAGTVGEKRVAPGEPMAQLFEEAVIGIYAEGDVEVVYGTVQFRAQSLYLEPRTFRGLLVDASFDGRLTGKGLEQTGVPVHVRAQRGRLVAKGLLVFDRAEVATNRSDDRLMLQVQQLTVEQMEEEGRKELTPEKPGLLGFTSVDTQRFRARGIRARGERVPLGYLPYASFGTSTRDPFPMTLKRADAGNRSSLGAYAFLGLGGDIGPENDPWLTWIVDLGGYTKRGAAGGLELSWDEPRSKGEIATWGVIWDQGVDRDGYVPDDTWLRGRLVSESRTTLAPNLILDHEFSTFTDRGFNREYFEREDLTHKDRESYLRLLTRQPTWAATLTGKWHERDFVTETTEAPEAGLWAGSLPLLTPSRLGGFGVDVTSVSRAGWLGRRFDDALGLLDHEAFRSTTDTRVNAGFDVGDVRVAGYVGAAVSDYADRNDGGEDLTRTALLAGLSGNLQMHRTTAARGGPFRLDGLRHVVDLEAAVQGRFFDSADPADVPFFDELEEERQRTQVVARARHRLQTRRSGRVAQPPRDVLDLETSFAWHVDDRAPYLQDTPWTLEWSMRGEPHPDAAWILASEGWVDGNDGLRALTGAVGFRPRERIEVALAYRYLRDEAAAPLVQASWRFSERYEVRVTESFNFRNERNFFRLLFRRFSADHVWTFGASVRDGDDVGFEIDFRPAIGGAVGEPSAFESEVDLDPLGVFR